MKDTIRVTFDTNCFFDYYEPQRDKEIIEKIISLSKKEKIDMARTTRVMNDTYDKALAKGEKSKIWESIKSFPECDTIGTPFRLDHSRLDSGDFLASRDTAILEVKIRSCMKSASTEDIDHLLGHIYSKRDIFITRDKYHFIKNRECLKKACGVEIMMPDELLQYIEE